METNVPNYHQVKTDVDQEEHEEGEGDEVHPIRDPLGYALSQGEDSTPDEDKKGYWR